MLVQGLFENERDSLSHCLPFTDQCCCSFGQEVLMYVTHQTTEIRLPRHGRKCLTLLV